MNTKIKTVAAIACGIVAYGLSQSAQAAPVVVDGSFSDSLGQLGFNVTSPGWTQNGDGDHSYDFILNGTGNSLGRDGNVAMAAVTPSPDGGNYLGIDPVYSHSTGNEPVGNNWVSQTISGLTKGSTYTLSFYWAAAQQQGYSGTTTEGWNFSIGTSSGSVANTPGGLPSQTFAGWQTENFTFTASGTSELLKFVAEGGPSSGNPPFDLLDGVSIKQNVPDSSSTAGLLGLGVVAMGVAAGRRRFARA
ncbi:MAG TPA: VPDSG-CTERM sorting domain-containing protein [Verrucomicrobiae bacterium]|jgi:hypothetical protein